jgi:predicted dinucleotide-binding enzyme
MIEFRGKAAYQLYIHSKLNYLNWKDNKMNISIFGTGNMARGIGYRLVAGGNSVTVFGRDAVKSQALANELRKAVKAGATVSVAKIGDSIHDGVVVLAMWYSGNIEIAQKFSGQLAGKIVVDISNALNDTYDGLTIAPDTSAGEQVAAALPKSKVVKAFNTTFANTLVEGKVAGQPLDVFIAGNDESAKATVANLVKAGGLVSIDAGPIHRARQLEALGLLGITLQGPHNLGFMSAWKLIH